jgi:hypothetical protein
MAMVEGVGEDGDGDGRGGRGRMAMGEVIKEAIGKMASI